MPEGHTVDVTIVVRAWFEQEGGDLDDLETLPLALRARLIRVDDGVEVTAAGEREIVGALIRLLDDKTRSRP